MLHQSTLQLLRFHFSVFLMPVFWFALSQTPAISIWQTLLVFFILHVLVYPASNGYNSYMDRDTESIGGLKNPQQPTKELYRVTLLMDALAIVLSFFIGLWMAVVVVAVRLASRAYSYRGIRLKKYPVLGYLTVIIFQGALVFYMVKYGCSTGRIFTKSWSALAGASLLIGAFYPLTQIYQHRQDAEDGVRSISAMLGYKGTFLFSAIVFFMAMASLAWYFGHNLELDHFLIIQLIMIPALVFFLWWMVSVFKDVKAANFKNTMTMNLVGSICSNAAFLTILIIEKF